MIDALRSHRHWRWGLLLLGFLALSIVLLVPTHLLDHHLWAFLGNSDSRFHVLRIEGLVSALKEGDWWPALNPLALNGLGYATPIFYSNLPLYFPAVLRLLGLTPAAANVLMLIMINFLTLASSYTALRQLVNRRQSLLFTLLYTCSGYRGHDLIYRQDIGELCAMIFLPWVLVGTYEILRGQKNRWWFLALGMVGIIYTHPLTPVLAALLVVMMILGSLKQLWADPTRIVAGLKAVGLSGLLSLGYFGPMLVQLAHDQLRFMQPTTMNIGQNAIPWAQKIDANLFSWFDVPNLGWVLLLALVVVTGQAGLKRLSGFDVWLLVWTLGLVALTFNSPVWPLLSQTFLVRLQFPWRLDMLITLLIAYLAAKAAGPLSRHGWIVAGVSLVAIAVALFGMWQVRQRLPHAYQTTQTFNQINFNAVGGGFEYLPKNATPAAVQTLNHQPQATQTVSIRNFKQVGSTMTLDFVATKPTTITLPLLGYYGYQARVGTKHLPVGKNATNNDLLTVRVSGRGHLRVFYQRPRLATLDLGASALTLLACLGYGAWRWWHGR